MKPIYVLGTGLSHNGSAVLLKDGKVCVAIEKERITRKKHDGGNDTEAIRYCLEAEDISLDDVAVVVQSANFEVPSRERFHGERLFVAHNVPLISISHHLAHAYSAAGTCDFAECNIMVIDGCESPLEQCTEAVDHQFFTDDINTYGMLCEKDSFYYFDGQTVVPLFKDFSQMAFHSESNLHLQTTQHSIGGFYAAISRYVFGNLDDVGKLMGLAPYGKPGMIEASAFRFHKGRLFVREEWKKLLDKPALNYDNFKENFGYYANVAYWAQAQVEMAVRKCFEERLSLFPAENVAYSGGVALNAVANAMLLNEKIMSKLYIEPAAGDNGLALGCAFYGWLEVLGKLKIPHDGNTCFGKAYNKLEIEAVLENAGNYTITRLSDTELVETVASLLKKGNIIGWFQSGAEFGPRALGHRSILAHPGINGLGDKINAQVKFREDFRPFAPAVLPEFAENWFESGRKSPYMILVDRTKPEKLEHLKNVTHVNGTARVQTVDASWNERFFALLEAFHRLTDIPVLLNTSFNKKGMPIVETPQQALDLFAESAIDVLVLENYIIVNSE